MIEGPLTVPPLPGLRLPDASDIVSLDPEVLAQLRLDQLLELMRQCGLSTIGIENADAAALRLIERAALG